MKVALYGPAGNMGLPVLLKIIKLDEIEHINLLFHSPKSEARVMKQLSKKEKKKITSFFGSVANKEVIRDTLKDVDIVIDMAAVIPPLSDKNPLAAIEANEEGIKVIISEIEKIKENQPKLIHISTVGLYGNRNEKHTFGEVGDPLLVSPFDIYAVTKMRGEFNVLESDIKCWCVIRQSAMLYNELLFKNISDGLMFHTCFNAPLEWVSASDSATLIQNILLKEYNHELNESNFWKKVFDLTGGKANRITGYETLNAGFKMIGGSSEKYFKTNYNCLRNFHGLYYRKETLQEMFNYQHDTVTSFWNGILKKHPYYALARCLPSKLIAKLTIKPLLKDDNAPYYWLAHNDEAKIIAYFGSIEKYNSIPEKWDDFPLNNKNKGMNGEDIDYSLLKEDSPRINHYFDIDKNDDEIDINDLIAVANAHGGKLLTKDFKKGDIYTKVLWENQDGESFLARPYTILKAGHWWNVSYYKYAWDFDRLAKKDKIYAQIWYDSHAIDENYYYYLDDNFKACITKR